MILLELLITIGFGKFVPAADEATADEATANLAVWICGWPFSADESDISEFIVEAGTVFVLLICWFWWAAANWATILDPPSFNELETK